MNNLTRKEVLFFERMLTCNDFDTYKDRERIIDMRIDELNATTLGTTGFVDYE